MFDTEEEVYDEESKTEIGNTTGSSRRESSGGNSISNFISKAIGGSR
jgi:hypothetical protein